MLPTRTLYLSFTLVAFFSIYVTFQAFFFSSVILPNTSTTNLLTKNTDSWFEPKTKIIMILIDALRYDFFAYNETIEGQEEFIYQNKFKKVHNIVKNEPENFVMMRAYSDSPTFTVRRTRALVTGTIPPFIMVAQTLGGQEAPEDSIPRQMYEAGRKVYTAGEPLWFQIFPKYVVDAFQSRSFDINSLDSEIIVADKIRSVVDENKFDVLIGHPLGVDHVGHFYGSDLDSRIGEQLTVSDDLISDVMHKMDNNTVLVVLGDHGMAHDGNHGGATDDETSTVIAAYYKQGFQKYNTPELSQVMKSIQERSTQINQVNMAPTLAMLLGVPIPFSNLGQIINDMYPNSDTTNSRSKFAAQMLRDNYLNTLQISQNLDTYNTEAYAFQETVFAPVKTKFQDIQAAYIRTSAMDQQTPEFEQEAVKVILQMQEFSEDAYALVRGTNFFDRTLVSLGASIMIITLISHILLGIHAFKCQGYDKKYKTSQGISSKQMLKKVITDKFLYGIVCGGLIIWAITRVKTIHIVSSIVLALTLKIVIHLGVAVFFPKRKNAFNESKSDKIDLAESKASLELANKELILSELPDQDQISLIHEKTGSQSKLNSPYLHIIVAMSLLITAVVLSNVEETVKVLEFANWHFLRYQINEVMAMVLLCAANTFIKNRTLRILTYIGVLIAYAIVVIVDAWTTAPIVQSIFFPPVFIWFARSQSRYLDHAHNKPYLAWLHTLTASILWIYYLPSDRGDDIVAITIPRLIYGLILVTAVTGCLLRRSTMSQNLKLCLTELLFLLQGPLHLFPFISLLMAMHVINYLCKRYRLHSFLYAQVFAVGSYFGLYLLDHTDRTFSHIKFGTAFIGLRHFNIYLSVPMVLLNLFTSFILGMMFMSNHLQDMKANWMKERHDDQNTKSSTRDVENDEMTRTLDISEVIHAGMIDQNEEESSRGSIEKLKSVKEKISLISRRDYLVFIFFFGIVYMVALVNNTDFIFGFGSRVFEAERYVYDSTIYIFMLVCGAFFIL